MPVPWLVLVPTERSIQKQLATNLSGLSSVHCVAHRDLHRQPAC